MNTIIKRVVLMLLVVVMVTGMVACGGTGTAIPSGAQQGGNQQGGNQQGGEDIGTGELGVVTYPLDTDADLSIWCYSSAAPVYKSYKSYKQSPWHSGLVSKTGVDIEWIHPVEGADNQQAFNLLMLNEDLPSIVCYSIDPGKAQLLYNEGAIVDLKPYLAKYAPDYWEFLTAPGHEEFLRSVTTEDGQIYMFRAFNEAPNVAYGPVVRKDWLDECGLDIPVTIEDWEVMLRTFREQYGAKFAFPISRFLSAGLASGFGAYGSMKCNYYLDNGEIKLAQTQPEFKAYLETMARWVKEGLVDIDSLIMTDEGFRTKAINNNTGAAFVVMSLFTKIINDSAAERTAAEWVAVPYPVVNEGEPTSWVQYSGLTSVYGSFVTTSNTEEEIIAAVQWLNYFYCEDGINYAAYGILDDTYYIDENGLPQYTDKVLKDRDGPSAGAAKYTGYGNTPVAGYQPARVPIMKNDPVVSAGSAIWLANTKAADAVIPTLVLTADEASEYADLSMATFTYGDEQIMKILAGETSIDKWDSVVAHMYDLGLQEMLDIQNAAYQRYLKGE